ncbi:MAG: hypothetical protein HXX09_09205, partial [Bacteroidetes bacterium]|nr:hypothetical protein [Bacteroidota bacterium]
MNAQILFTNNDAVIFANANSTILINGSIQNVGDSLYNKGKIIIRGNNGTNGDLINNGLISGNGEYELTGNWINNGIFNSCLSSVKLNSVFPGEQLISGNTITNFYKLTTAGITKKRMTINAFIKNSLDLTDNELAADSFVLHVLNPNLQAISRTTGFISTLNSGKLARTTGIAGPYNFPLGSTNGVPRYRPVIIKPDSNNLNVFSVGFINHSAGSDGYLLSANDASICYVDSNFYHKIIHNLGTDSADVTIFFDPTVDGGIWSMLANWKNAPFNEWQNVGNVNTIYTPINGFTKEKQADFSSEPWVLA